MKKSPYNEEQQAFLDKTYKGITDPDQKILLLTQALGCSGSVCFHATQINETKDGLTGVEDKDILIVTKIAILEYELLVQEALLKPEYY